MAGSEQQNSRTAKKTRYKVPRGVTWARSWEQPDDMGLVLRNNVNALPNP
jgi:hypothetical protein